jgi:hypothetical protein
LEEFILLILEEFILLILEEFILLIFEKYILLIFEKAFSGIGKSFTNSEGILRNWKKEFLS